ncbi:PLC-like phosphodiesterase [Neocallimastix californiae]|uniref:PLC-like phosphodiesterase n=1 Tax=Neocallimastix californiae TaxID=1754190 RepID=A0A1Y2FJE2_9FUNG|nr:PLC-like phosphodiesterase [Neocallimastix californiae]|eukprot:ORY83366.1 PLC-like phosphodiesterase [Neocallimastix californiae]
MSFIIKNIIYYTLLIHFFTQLINAQRKCNGYESLCNKSYNEVVYPTTHNSFAVGKTFSSNQELSIDKQLTDGIRGLMLDIYPYEDGSIHFCHTDCNDPMFLDAGNAVDILSIITSFLQQNPNEVITIFIENFNGNVPADQINEIFTSSGLINYVYTPSSHDSWPTLNEMIDNHQNVVVFSDKLHDEAYPWYLSLDEYVSYNNYVSLQNENWNCDVYGGDGSLFLLYHMKHVQILDKGYLPDTSSIDKTNSLDGINEHTQYCDRNINYLAVDFYNHGDVVAFAAGLNGEDYSSKQTGSKAVSGSQNKKFSKYQSLTLLFLLSFLFI